MLEIEPQELQLCKYDKQKSLKLTNRKSFPVLYKIKTTILEAISAFPTAGMLEPDSAVEIGLRIIMEKDFEAKIMVSCLNISGREHQSPETIWPTAPKSEISNTIVRIKKRSDLDPIKEQDTTSKVSEASQQVPRHTFPHPQEAIWQKKYQDELSNSNRLKQKLQIAQGRLVEVMKQSHQVRINHSIRNGTDEYYSVTLNNIILTCLLFFIFGYVLARLY